jgi:hypothetical protein
MSWSESDWYIRMFTSVCWLFLVFSSVILHCLFRGLSWMSLVTMTLHVGSRSLA